MDKNTLLISPKKSKVILSVAFIILSAAMIVMLLLAYAGATHRSILPMGLGGIFGAAGHGQIAVIYVEGQMVSDKSPGSSGSAFSSDIVRYLRNATDDPDVKAIVLRVNSPGGTPVAAEEIISQINRTKQVKPIIVSMGDMATSAAYYISSQTDRIIADPDTFTGSIGVIWVFENKSKYYSEDGISFYVAKSGEYKDLGSDRRGLTSDEKNYVQDVINESYDRFVDNVAAGRNISVDKVRSIADGRMYTGTKAKELGLVDELGGLYDAIVVAKDMANVTGSVEIVYMNEPSAK